MVSAELDLVDEVNCRCALLNTAGKIEKYLLSLDKVLNCHLPFYTAVQHEAELSPASFVQRTQEQ